MFFVSFPFCRSEAGLVVTPLYGYFRDFLHCPLLLVVSLRFSSSSAFLRPLFTQSSHLSCGLARFLQPSCFFVSDLFRNLSPFTGCSISTVMRYSLLQDNSSLNLFTHQSLECCATVVTKYSTVDIGAETCSRLYRWPPATLSAPRRLVKEGGCRKFTAGTRHLKITF